MELASGPTAWDMSPETLMDKFAEFSIKTTTARGTLLENYQLEMRYIKGVITARILGKDKELPFRRGDKIVLRNSFSDAKRGMGLPTRLAHDHEIDELRDAELQSVIIVPRSNAIEVPRIFYEDGNFWVDLTATTNFMCHPALLFPASDFMLAEECESAAA